MNSAIVILTISLWFSISLVMGIFSITQRGYQDRMSSLEEGIKSFYSFIRGFLFWPVAFPQGLARERYKCKVIHKVSNGRRVLRKI